MPDEQELSSPEVHAGRAAKRNKFLRWNAWFASGLGILQLLVNILGKTFIWILHVRWAAQGYEDPPVLPDPPWNLPTAIFGFVILSLVGYAFWTNQIGEPGKVVEMITGWMPWKKTQTGSD